MRCFIFLAVLVGTTLTLKLPNEQKKRQLTYGLFSIVQFPNDRCIAGTSDQFGVMYGTCLSSEECSSKGGKHDGKCASGFGICCTFVIDKCESGGVSVTNNCTYVQNPEYPNARSTAAASTCSYIFKGGPSICQIRLDFANVVLLNPTTAFGPTSGICQPGELLVVKSTTKINSNNILNLCGTLSGTHAYVETGGQPDGASLTITTSTALGANRSWKIKASMIECESNDKAPNECVQYFTGASGSFESYNYQNGNGQSIFPLQHTYCFRQEEGYCSISYRQSQNKFALFYRTTMNGAPINISMRPMCMSYLYIPYHDDVFSPSNTDAFCGSIFGSLTFGATATAVTSYATSFQATYRATIQAPAMFANSPVEFGVGFRIIYSQLPCAN